MLLFSSSPLHLPEIPPLPPNREQRAGLGWAQRSGAAAAGFGEGAGPLAGLCNWGVGWGKGLGFQQPNLHCEIWGALPGAGSFWPWWGAATKCWGQPQRGAGVWVPPLPGVLELHGGGPQKSKGLTKVPACSGNTTKGLCSSSPRHESRHPRAAHPRSKATLVRLHCPLAQGWQSGGGQLLLKTPYWACTCPGLVALGSQPF